jgi:hypothetical protein
VELTLDSLSRAFQINQCGSHTREVITGGKSIDQSGDPSPRLCEARLQIRDRVRGVDLRLKELQS